MAKCNPIVFSFEGKDFEFRSIRAAAKHFGKNQGTVHGRMKVGWTAEEALELVRKTGTCVICGSEFVHPLKYSKPDKIYCSLRCSDKTRDREHANAMSRARRKADPEKYRNRERRSYLRNPEVKRRSNKKRYLRNREEMIKKHTAWEADQMKSNPLYALRKRLRDRLRKAIKNQYKAGSAVRDLGCSIEFLKNRFESMFRDGMSWENYGTLWVIDHIYPITRCNIEDRTEFLAVNNWRNLQPLTIPENLRKNDKITQQARALFFRLCSKFKNAA